MHRGRWRSKRTMSPYLRPAEYTNNASPLTAQKKKLEERFRDAPLECFGVAPPEVREFGTDSNFAAGQQKGGVVAGPGYMLTL